jgi:asparagine synthase (glutamine-hydrolysing)
VFHDVMAVDAIFPDLILRPGAREASAARFKDFRTRMFAVDQTSHLESMLLRQDKMAMAMGVEARVPFTHWPLARVINRIPLAIRAPGGKTKPLLKDIAEPFLPHDLIHRRKNGLRLPLRDWVRDRNGLGRYLECLTAQDSKIAQFANIKRLRHAVNAFREGRHEAFPPFEQLINIELWLRSLKVAA